jgi:hypothetical protein
MGGRIAEDFGPLSWGVGWRREVFLSPDDACRGLTRRGRMRAFETLTE